MKNWLRLFCLMALFSCQGHDLTYVLLDFNYSVYRPEAIEDEKTPAEIFSITELVNNEKLTFHQKCLVEAFFTEIAITDLKDELSTEEEMAIYSKINTFIVGLGIRNLDIFLNFKIKNIKYLEFYSTSLDNINGIRAFEDLTSLVLRGSELTSFEAIATLPKLTRLDISYSRATNLESLNKCINLEELTIDKESNFSLEPIEHLMREHLNNNGKLISLKIKTISQKLKNNPVHPYYREDPPALENRYWVEAFYSKARDKETAIDLDADERRSDKNRNITGEASFKDGIYSWKMSSKSYPEIDFIRTGTYKKIHNFIYFTDDTTGESWYSGADWSPTNRSILNITERFNTNNEIYRRYRLRIK